MAGNDFIRMKMYESLAIVPMKVYTAGTYVIPLFVEGNSLLSTLYVKSCSGSVQVNYYDFGAGNDELPGERINLGSHALINVADKSDRVIITRIHNRPKLELIVTGTVELCIYGTVVSQFASDLDAALILDHQAFVSSINKAIPIALLDPDTNQLVFARGINGMMSLTQDFGSPKILTNDVSDSVPNGSVVLLEYTIPASNEYKIYSFQGCCRAYGKFLLFYDNVKIGQGNTSPNSENVQFNLPPFQRCQASKKIKVTYTQIDDESVDVNCFVYGTQDLI